MRWSSHKATNLAGGSPVVTITRFESVNQEIDFVANAQNDKFFIQIDFKGLSVF